MNFEIITGILVISSIGLLTLLQRRSSTTVPPRVASLTVSGLYNSGNTCFINSILQAISSMPSLLEHLSTHNSSSHVTEALVKLSQVLVLGPGGTYQPSELLNALSGKGNTHLLGYQQQDAHEFFQHLSSLLTTEDTPQDKGLMDLDGTMISRRRSPILGLLASQISCLQCGLRSTVRHDVFDNLSLSVPVGCSLNVHTLLVKYTEKEIINGYVCDKCSLLATRLRLEAMIAMQPDTEPTNVKEGTPGQAKKRKEVRRKKRKKLETSLKLLVKIIDEGYYDGKVPEGVELIKIRARTLKQTTIGRPPNCFCLHMQRSVYLGDGTLIKNNEMVLFEDILDINDLVLGKLRTSERPFIYKLTSVVLHYGQHDSGHFVTLRRIKHLNSYIWFRLSDANVERIHDVQQEVFDHGSRYAYMLFYERLEQEVW